MTVVVAVWVVLVVIDAAVVVVGTLDKKRAHAVAVVVEQPQSL